MRNVLITGANSGIGKEVAHSLHTSGYTVFGTSRNPERHQEELDFELLELDVTDDESVRSCIDTFTERTESIDILINNAGFAQVGSTEETNMEQARSQMETNFWGYVKLTQAVLPHMRSQRSGYIINVSSLAGSVGVPLQGYYSASKHAVDGFTKSLRMEVQKFGIKVVLLKPGFVKTNMHHSFQKAERSIADYKEISQQVEQALNGSIEGGIDPSAIGERILKILRSDNPKQSYAVGIDGKLLPILNLLFPRLFEYGSRKKFHLD